MWVNLENKLKFLVPLLPFILVALIVVVSFIANLSMLGGLDSNKAPPGADYGNYLTQVNILKGTDLRGWGLRHQPLFFYFLGGVMDVFDAFTALKVASAFVFAIAAVPFFLLARKLSHNNYAALVCTALFAFFISSSEMISWGGNPNFLGFSFMLLALYFVIDVANKRSKTSIVLSGLFFSLVVGTHILVAVFAFGTLLLFAVLHVAFVGKRTDLNKEKVKTVFYLGLAAALFSLPYVSFYQTFFRNSSSEMVGFRLFGIHLSAPAVGDLWGLIPFFVIGVVGGLGLFALAKYFKGNQNSHLIVTSLLLAPFILVVTTAQPIRWLYFLPIPFLLSFSIFLDRLHFDVKQTKKVTIILFTVLFIITIFLQSTHKTGEHFADATKFYQFVGDDEVQALDWIRNNTPSGTVFATSGTNLNVGGGGNSYAWWVEGYSNRICMFTGDLEYYSFQFEREDVRETNRIFAGTYALECRNLQVVDSYPADVSNPKISVQISDKYEGLLTVNDGQNQLLFSPNDNPKAMSIGAFYSNESTVNIQNYTSYANLSVSYVTAQFELFRSVMLNASTGETNPFIDLVYQIHPLNVTLNAFKINLWSLFETSLENCSINGNSVTIYQGSSENDLSATISLVDTNGEFGGARVLFENPKSSPPVVNYVFKPTSGDLFVHLRVTLNSPASPPDSQEMITVYYSYEQLNDLKVNYILLNRYRDTEHQRFSADTTHFKLVFQNEQVEIFEVFKQT